MSTPTAILAAFAPAGQPLELDMLGILLLEAEKSPLLTGGDPSYRDLFTALLIITDSKSYHAARRAGTVDALIEEKATGFCPADFLQLMPHVQAALHAAFGPVQGASSEKKPDPAAESAGG